jgi:predicted Zn-dependent protease
MKKTFHVLTVIAVIVLAFACSRVPITNRKQVSLIPESQLIGMSITNYQQFLDTNKVVPNTDKRTQMVQKIGTRIQAAVEKYLADNKQSARVEGFQWEFNVVESDQVNAWCMPGGKVVVYTGILPVTQDEISLAVVMGHEIAHAIARHGNERMSEGLIVNAGGQALGAVLQTKPTVAQNIFLQSYGLGSQLGMLAYSRRDETEADKLGLVFMAMAGYNPEAAIPFWERMSQSGGQKPPEILSTHPSDETRIATLKEWMPEAKKYFVAQP